jgi:hypothetical protein
MRKKLKRFQQTKLLLFCNLLCFSSYQVIGKLSPATAVESNTPVGANLGPITYYSSAFPFINAFKSASKWRTICIPRTDPGCNTTSSTREEDLLKLDRNGWVRSLPTREDPAIYTRVRASLFAGVGDRYPGGQYVVLYKGEGKILYGGAAKLVSSQLGRDVINVDSSTGRGMWIDIVSTDPLKNGNYLRDIILVKATDENIVNSKIFNQKFIDKLKGFHVIRFMDWMGTNGSTEQSWNKRPLTTSATYTDGTVSVEVMTSLSNQVQASPWFNMPHMADNTYVTSFAKVVKARLKPTLKVYVEYSNEVWNNSFPQGNWVKEQATTLWPASQYPQTALTKKLNWHGKRTAEICEIWKTVFADRPQSVVCVLGSQAANPWASTQALDCPLWVKKPCYNKVDALGIAAYFGRYIGLPDNQDQISSWSLDELFQEINLGGLAINSRPGGALADIKTQISNNFQLAAQRNLKLFAYEGGQHLVGVSSATNNQNLTNMLIAANRDPRMYIAYTTLLNYWKNSGGSVFMSYNYVNSSSKWGSWGLLEHIDDANSPKYQAVKDFIRNNP